MGSKALPFRRERPRRLQSWWAFWLLPAGLFWSWRQIQFWTGTEISRNSSHFRKSELTTKKLNLKINIGELKYLLKSRRIFQNSNLSKMVFFFLSFLFPRPTRSGSAQLFVIRSWCLRLNAPANDKNLGYPKMAWSSRAFGCSVASSCAPDVSSSLLGSNILT